MTTGGAALVTGGAKRIGRELVLGLAIRGLDVAVHYNTSREDARATAAEAVRHGVNAKVVRADFSDERAVLSLVDQATEVLGRPLTVLVNNASRFERDEIETATMDGFGLHFRSNIQAPFFLTQRFAEQVPNSGPVLGGEPVAAASIINMIDQRVLRPTSEFASYSVSKAALWSLTQISAIALAPHIRVNAIGPGPTLPSPRQTAEHFSRQRRGSMLQRGADVGDIVAAMNFILDANSLTGQLICLDGGQFLRWHYAPSGDA